MGTRKQREKQEEIWIAHTELAAASRHSFYQKLNELLEAEGFDEFVESRCAKFYAETYGRPSLTPGIYFRSLNSRLVWRMSFLAGCRARLLFSSKWIPSYFTWHKKSRQVIPNGGHTLLVDAAGGKAAVDNQHSACNKAGGVRG